MCGIRRHGTNNSPCPVLMVQSSTSLSAQTTNASSVYTKRARPGSGSYPHARVSVSLPQMGGMSSRRRSTPLLSKKWRWLAMTLAAIGPSLSGTWGTTYPHGLCVAVQAEALLTVLMARASSARLSTRPVSGIYGRTARAPCNACSPSTHGMSQAHVSARMGGGSSRRAAILPCGSGMLGR
jgi:hypothetical protein